MLKRTTVTQYRTLDHSELMKALEAFLGENIPEDAQVTIVDSAGRYVDISIHSKTGSVVIQWPEVP